MRTRPAHARRLCAAHTLNTSIPLRTLQDICSHTSCAASAVATSLLFLFLCCAAGNSSQKGRSHTHTYDKGGGFIHPYNL